MAGVTTTGFQAKTQDDVTTGLKGVWRSVYGAFANVADRSRNGQFIAGIAAPIAEVWKLGEDLFSFFSAPSGVLLDQLAKLTGTTRLPATPSSVTLTLTGTPTTLVASGKVAAVNGSTAQFATTAPATIATVTAWAQSTTYATAGLRRTANGNVYQVRTPGISLGSGTGPAGTGSSIIDGTVEWFFLGVGTGAVDVAAASTVTGPVQGYSGTINIISTPVSGWSSVFNVLDATPGTNVETDPQLRVRRAQEIAASGTSPLDAIRARLLKVSGVVTAIVWENTLDVTTNGIAAHGIECLVEGGLDQDVANTIFSSESAGIETSGTSSASVVDSAGNTHTIKFSRPTDINIYASVAVLVDPAIYPPDGNAQVADAVVAAGNALRLGFDVFNGALIAAVMGVAGVLNVTSCFVDTVPSPASSQVVITPRQEAAFDTSRVTVTSTPGSS